MNPASTILILAKVVLLSGAILSTSSVSAIELKGRVIISGDSAGYEFPQANDQRSILHGPFDLNIESFSEPAEPPGDQSYD